MTEQEPTIDFIACRPIEADARQVMEWRNDPITLAMSYHQDPKRWESFWPEYRDGYFRMPALLQPVFAVDGKAPVGFIKFGFVPDPRGGEARTVDISINIAPAARGLGLGRKVLKACLAYLAERDIDAVYAEVLVGNTASLRTFQAAGFSPLGPGRKHIEDTGETHDIERFLADLTPWKRG